MVPEQLQIISMYLTGQGRNQITRTLNEQGMKISSGSVTNIINRHKCQHQETSQPRPSSENARISTGVPMNIPACSPLLDGIGKAAIHRDGGPFSHLLPIEDKCPTESEINFGDTPIGTDIFSDDVDYDPEYDGVEGERRFNYQYTNTINPFRNNFTPCANNFNQQSSRPHVIEETKETSEEELDQASNSLGMDWDENHEARFVKWVMDQKSIR